ncbi:MAG: hypothetical protein WCH44_16435, partial [Betaproteobacteria bacterium]
GEIGPGGTSLLIRSDLDARLVLVTARPKAAAVHALDGFVSLAKTNGGCVNLNVNLNLNQRNSCDYS